KVFEPDAGACHQILHRTGNDHVMSTSELRHAGGDVHGAPTPAVPGQLNLAGVDADAYRNFHMPQGVANGDPAMDRPRRTIEGGQKTVAERFHLFPPET